MSDDIVYDLEGMDWDDIRERPSKAAALMEDAAAEITRLRARVAELEGALKDAAASVKEWGAYASQYLQDKWDLPGEVARYIAVAEGKNDAAREGKKE
ncbi:MAG: hypothetical protein ACK5PR_03030 [bacterium]|jgi:hypothetical protein